MSQAVKKQAIDTAAIKKDSGKIVRTRTGLVVSVKMDKTITLLLERKVQHPLYRKYIKRSTKIYAHDEQNQVQQGDIVTVRECRPLSKKKNWVLVSVDKVGKKAAEEVKP